MERPDYIIKEYRKTVDLREFIETCVDIPRIRGFCETCPNYCRFWSCPEHDFDPLLYWKLFRELELWGRQIILSDELKEKSLTPEEQAKAIDKTFFVERRHFMDLLKSEETGRSISLHVGHCDICGPDNCARPEGKPCRFPKKKRFSMESLGADVVKAAEKYFGIPLCWPENGKLPDYFVLVGGLLKL